MQIHRTKERDIVRSIDTLNQWCVNNRKNIIVRNGLLVGFSAYGSKLTEW